MVMRNPWRRLHSSVCGRPLLILSGCVVGPKYHPPSAASAGPRLQRISRQFQRRPGLDSCTACGCQAPRQVVGDLQRSRTERPRRSTGYQQSEHQTILRKLHGSSRHRARGPLAIFSHANRRALGHPLASLGERWVDYSHYDRQPAQLLPNCKARSTRCLSKLPGSPTFGARFATRSARLSTPHRSARPISRTSVSPSRPASHSFFLRFAARISCNKIFDETVAADQKVLRSDAFAL